MLSGLEVVRALNDAGRQTRRPITIIDWTNEEGSRFPPPMIASGVFAGILSMGEVSELKDADGVRFADALEASGYAGSEPVGARRFSAYLEYFDDFFIRGIGIQGCRNVVLEKGACVSRIRTA